MASSSTGRGAPASSRGVTKPRNSDGRDVRTSKSLSFLLRHGGPKEGIPIGADGYAPLAAVLGHRTLQNVTVDDVRRVVANNEKQRFALDESDPTNIRIRATQGHTIKTLDSDLLHKPVERAYALAQLETVVHGTNRAAWDRIRSSGGLKPMSRVHIHLAKGLLGEAGVISGMRATADTFIYINMISAIDDGIPFFESSNGVILTPGADGLLSLKYFSRVTDASGAVLYP